LFEDPDFGQRYVDRWGAVADKHFSASNLLARVDELRFSQEPAARNFERWRSWEVVEPEVACGQKTFQRTRSVT